MSCLVWFSTEKTGTRLPRIRTIDIVMAMANVDLYFKNMVIDHLETFNFRKTPFYVRPGKAFTGG